MNEPRKKLFLLVFSVMIIALGIVWYVLREQTVDVSQFTSPYIVEIYQDGAIRSETKILHGTAEEKVIADWLCQHQEGWFLSLNTYVPSHVIRGHGFRINILSDNLCVLNYEVSGSYYQLTRTLKPVEVEELFKVFKK
jgi:hypothetical protein